MTVRRNGQRMDIPIVSSKINDGTSMTTGIDPNATPLETAIRKGIVGK